MEGKKVYSQDCTAQNHTSGYELWPQKSNKWLEECFESMCHFSMNYILHCSKRPRLSPSQDFLKYCFNNLCYQLLQIVTWTDEISHMARPTCKCSKSCSSYLLSEHGDLSFLLYFSKQCLIQCRKHSGKEKKTVQQISDEILLNDCATSCVCFASFFIAFWYCTCNEDDWSKVNLSVCTLYDCSKSLYTM